MTDQFIEFFSIIESADMPEHLRSALMEAYEQSHELNRTPLTQDEKNSLLDRFARNNRINGIPFNRAATEKDMDAHPWKYRKFVNRRPAPIRQLQNNNNILNPTAADARNKIYSAVLDTLARFYAQYHIPFNAAAQFKYIQHVDKTIKHMPFDRGFAMGSLKFDTFRDANTNPIVRQLSDENMAFRQVMVDAYKFAKELEKCGDDEREKEAVVMYERMKQMNETAPEIQRPKAKLVGSDAEEYERKQATEKLAAQMAATKETNDPSDVAELHAKMPNLPYSELYERISSSASPEALEALPKPGENFVNAMYRIDRNDSIDMPFMRKLHQVVDIAYPGIDLESELKKLQGNRDFRDFFGVLQDTFEKSLVHPQDKTLFEIWRTLHELKEVSARLGR